MISAQPCTDTIRVLYLDDGEDDRELVRQSLSQDRDVRITEASSLAELEHELAAGEVDVVLSDFDVWGGERFAAIDHVRERYPHVPVVIITGKGSEEVVIEAWNRGAANYVMKTPECIEGLPSTLRSVLEKDPIMESIGTVPDNTEHKRLEDELRFTKIAVDSSTAAILWVRSDATFRYANDAVAEELGYTRDELLSMTVHDIDPAFSTEMWPEFWQQLKCVGSVTMETMPRRKDGTAIPVELTANLVEYEGEEFLFAVVTDITERKQAAERLQASEAKYRALVENSHDVINLFSPTGDLLYTSPSVKRVLGYEPEEIMKLHAFEVLHPEDAEHADRDLREYLDRPGAVGYFTYRLKHKDGTFRTVDVTGTNLLHEPGINAMVSIFHDTTDRLEAARAQRNNERLLEATNRVANVGGWELDVVNMELKWTAQTCRIHEVSADYCPDVEKAITFYAPEARPIIEAAVQAAIDHGTPWDLELPFITAQGRQIWVRAQGEVETKEGQAVRLYGAFQDITERKKAEKALRESERRLVAAQRIAKMGDFTWDVETGEVTWSEALFDLLGYDKSEHIDIAKVNTTIHHPDDLNRMRQWLKDCVNSGSNELTPNEYRLIRKDGKVISVRTVGVIERGGKSPRLFGTAHDITERKRAEEALRESEERLQLLNISLEQRVAERTNELEDKNAELQAFAHTASHDLRAPMRAIEGFATALQEDYGEQLDDDGHEYIQHIINSAQRMDSLVNDLLEYSRLGRNELRVSAIELNSIMTNAIHGLTSEISACKAELQVDDLAAVVMGHQTTLVQVVTNLLSNGMKFVAKGIRPKIRVWGQSQADGTVRLWIADNGVGIDEQYHDRVFHVFERLHGIESYPGTGIGLAIVSRACKRLGGCCGVESRPGEGSRFWVELPDGRTISRKQETAEN